MLLEPNISRFTVLVLLILAGDLAGDTLMLGDTALFRKLPWIRRGEGMPGMTASGAWESV